MPRGKHAAKEKSSVFGTIVSIVLIFVAVIAASFALREWVFQPYEIPTASMESTIMSHDLVFTEKLSVKASSPQKGEIITFYDPTSTSEEKVLIKRVIGTAGDVIDINDGNLFINGEKQDEDYVLGKKTYQLSYSSITYPYTIPEGELWMMGDNRTNSVDSRYFGSIPISSVIGRAVFVYWPIDHFGPLK